ncbi:MAG: DUF2461 domain-containing protein [Tunicatimonas sp.]
MITTSTLQFLAKLRANNNRDWFEAHRDDYLAAKANVTAFAEAVTAGLNQTDMIDRYRVYRIYRDLRFTKDRTHPYKEHFDGYLYRAGTQRRGGYVFRIGTDGNSQVGGGFFGPNKEDLRRIRQELAFDCHPMEEITRHPDFGRHFGVLQGEAVKTAPQGFSKDHPSIAWLRRKQFYALRSFTDREVLQPNFVEQTVTTFRALRPFFDYMSEVLTTNADGESSTTDA